MLKNCTMHSENTKMDKDVRFSYYKLFLFSFVSISPSKKTTSKKKNLHIFDLYCFQLFLVDARRNVLFKKN